MTASRCGIQSLSLQRYCSTADTDAEQLRKVHLIRRSAGDWSGRACAPLQAADELLLTREAIRAVARKHGHVVTFLPKLSTLQAGSGGHLHLSLWKVWAQAC